jgi:hypothetical protein
MKFTAALLTATTAAVASAQSDGQRNLATLAEKWNIADPEFLFDSNTFSLSFPVTDYINAGMADYSMWTAPDCLDGGVDISERDIWTNHELVENAALLGGAAYDSSMMPTAGNSRVVVSILPWNSTPKPFPPIPAPLVSTPRLPLITN